MPAFLDQLAATRDRLVGSARFRRWAAAFPLTRPIARRRARALFDLCAGFVYSQVLLACVRLKLFELLREGPRTAEEVARTTDVPLGAANTLLHAAVTLQLVSRRAGGRYGLGTLGAAMIDNPGIAAMVEHHALLYSDLRRSGRAVAAGAAATPALAATGPTPATPPAGRRSGPRCGLQRADVGVAAADRRRGPGRLSARPPSLPAGRRRRRRHLHRCGRAAVSPARADAVRPAGGRCAGQRRLSAAGLGERATVSGGGFRARCAAGRGGRHFAGARRSRP